MRDQTTLDMVEEFHKTFQRTPDPTTLQSSLPTALLEQRIQFIIDELEELKEAVEKQDRAAILQEITDVQYFLDGFYLKLGINSDMKMEAFREVHRANMSKRGPNGEITRRTDGKILKGDFYRAPDMVPILNKHHNIW